MVSQKALPLQSVSATQNRDSATLVPSTLTSSGFGAASATEDVCTLGSVFSTPWGSMATHIDDMPIDRDRITAVDQLLKILVQ